MTHIIIPSSQLPEVNPRPRQTDNHYDLNDQIDYASDTAVMRTYEDTFSGEKIYPGKVRCSGSTILFRVLRLIPRRIEPQRPLSEKERGYGHAANRFGTSQGKLYVRGDSKIFRFQNGKTESLFLQRKNPRRIAWTTLYRRQHKKGITEVRG